MSEETSQSETRAADVLLAERCIAAPDRARSDVFQETQATKGWFGVRVGQSDFAAILPDCLQPFLELMEKAHRSEIAELLVIMFSFCDYSLPQTTIMAVYFSSRLLFRLRLQKKIHRQYGNNDNNYLPYSQEHQQAE